MVYKEVVPTYLYGAEYDTWDSSPLSAVLDHNVPCAVCYICFNQGDSDDDTRKDCVPFLMDS